jgi:hypothetical protein
MTSTEENKSKIFSLANKLTATNGGDKSAAFIQAWAIYKAGGLELQIKGVTFGNRQEALKRLAAYNPDQIRAVLVPEPTNTQDPAAIAVMVGVQNGKGLFKIGYVPANITAIVKAIGANLPAFRVVCGTWGKYNSQKTYGGRLALAV